MTDNASRPWWRRLNAAALWLALLAVLTLVVAGPGHRFGLFDFRTAVLISLAGAAIAALGLIAALIALTLGRMGTPKRFGAGTLAGLVVGAGVLAQFASLFMQATSVPRIHDITTDTDDPPAFVAVAPLRADAPNPVEYPGEAVAEQQRRAYPDIRTLDLDAPPSEVLAAAEAYASEQGWEVHAVDTDAGRLEATATTTWFGYKDDVVVRARWSGSGTALDVRSKSRVGQSDLGANAKRIRGLLAALDPAGEPPDG